MSVPSWCRVGAKVAWVGEGMFNSHKKFQPKNGDIFTIDALQEDWIGGGDMPLVKVVEMTNHSNRFGGPWWQINRFRPLITNSLESDMESYFHQHLDQREDA